MANTNAAHIAAAEPGEGDDGDNDKDLPGVDYAANDAVLTRSEAAIDDATRPSGGADSRAAEKIGWSMISTGMKMSG